MIHSKKKAEEQDGETALIFEYCCEQTLHSIVKQSYPGADVDHDGGEGVGWLAFFLDPRLGFPPAFASHVWFWENNGKKTPAKTTKSLFFQSVQFVTNTTMEQNREPS